MSKHLLFLPIACQLSCWAPSAYHSYSLLPLPLKTGEPFSFHSCLLQYVFFCSFSPLRIVSKHDVSSADLYVPWWKLYREWVHRVCRAFNDKSLLLMTNPSISVSLSFFISLFPARSFFITLSLTLSCSKVTLRTQSRWIRSISAFTPSGWPPSTAERTALRLTPRLSSRSNRPANPDGSVNQCHRSLCFCPHCFPWVTLTRTQGCVL